MMDKCICQHLEVSTTSGILQKSKEKNSHDLRLFSMGLVDPLSSISGLPKTILSITLVGPAYQIEHTSFDLISRAAAKSRLFR
ncbi:hypothetical protein BpHYR1_020177 [Brachionus plicatilis]|uniref:Uncharacterized protein n=1 Tax=Brachionus plicatilis TaxID=10195 RepID=A0A3M7QNZ7_BRAPC|nr:hypothetical protein BpHYR1_020177 [Brachionus plicatilis]